MAVGKVYAYCQTSAVVNLDAKKRDGGGKIFVSI